MFIILKKQILIIIIVIILIVFIHLNLRIVLKKNLFVNISINIIISVTNVNHYKLNNIRFFFVKIKFMCLLHYSNI